MSDNENYNSNDLLRILQKALKFCLVENEGIVIKLEDTMKNSAYTQFKENVIVYKKNNSIEITTSNDSKVLDGQITFIG